MATPQRRRFMRKIAVAENTGRSPTCACPVTKATVLPPPVIQDRPSTQSPSLAGDAVAVERTGQQHVGKARKGAAMGDAVDVFVVCSNPKRAHKSLAVDPLIEGSERFPKR